MAPKDSELWETTKVLICGGGHTGALLSALLYRMSISNIVLEKESELYPYPRAFTLGENGLRLLQGVGLSDRICTEIGRSQRISVSLEVDILLN
jgi:2-polyprenyl-6-methoxyphenol hydroxylase-like FAD-dependent oxidoreductase